MGGYLVRAISWISLIFVNSMGALITIQILLGLGESLGSSAFSAIFAEHLDRNKHVKEYASWHLVSTLLGAASTLIGGLIVSIFGFNILFITMSLLAMASFIGVVVKPRKLL
jgi:MFS family permease